MAFLVRGIVFTLACLTCMGHAAEPSPQNFEEEHDIPQCADGTSTCASATPRRAMLQHSRRTDRAVASHSASAAPSHALHRMANLSRADNFYRKEGEGTWGGQCTCPDGQTYEVSDEGNWCGSLACEGGVPGKCLPGGIKPENSGMKVTCKGAWRNSYRQEPGVGGWGGICTCPDGAEYEVGDEGNSCGSIACEGGVAGPCLPGGIKDGNGGMKVTCATCNKIDNTSYWYKQLQKRGVPDAQISKICHQDNEWIYYGVATGVGKGPNKAACDNTKVICAGRGGVTYGWSAQQVAALFIAISNGGVHPEAPSAKAVQAPATTAVPSMVESTTTTTTTTTAIAAITTAAATTTEAAITTAAATTTEAAITTAAAATTEAAITTAAATTTEASACHTNAQLQPENQAGSCDKRCSPGNRCCTSNNRCVAVGTSCDEAPETCTAKCSKGWRCCPAQGYQCIKSPISNYEDLCVCTQAPTTTMNATTTMAWTMIATSGWCSSPPLGQKPASSLADCQGYCLSIPNCVFASYQARGSGLCMVYSTCEHMGGASQPDYELYDTYQNTRPLATLG